MCTLTWFAQPGGYQVFFNRDERRTRKLAVGPDLRRSGTIRFVAPLDRDHGGTWIAVNHRGLCLCLLNGFPAPDAPGSMRQDEYRSRGLVSLSLIEEHGLAGVLARLHSLDLRCFRSFMLAIFDPAGIPCVARWSGAALRVERPLPADEPLVSSSFCTDEVRNNRVAVFRRRVASGAPLERAASHLAYHRSHEPTRGALSPCMHRDEARTVSFSHVRVDSRGVRFSYVCDSPCRDAREQDSLFLARV